MARSNPVGLGNASYRKQQANDTSNYVSSLVIAGITDIMQTMIRDVGNGVHNSLSNSAQAFNAKVISDRRYKLKTIHERAARGAQQAIVDAWREGHSAPYRIGKGRNQRDAGGALLRAVSSPNFYRAANDGVDFINPVWMDSQARQWYRINFGAGTRGLTTPPGQVARLSILGQTTTVSPLARFKAGAATPLPPGWWAHGGDGQPIEFDGSRRGSGDAFYLRSSLKRKGIPSDLFPFLSHSPTPSLGFAGNRYLDVGIARLYENLGKEYENLIQSWLKEWKVDRSGPFASQGVVNAKVKDLELSLALANRTIKARTRQYNQR